MMELYLLEQLIAFSRQGTLSGAAEKLHISQPAFCLLYTSDAADDLLCIHLGGRRIIKKNKTTKKNKHNS